MPQPIIQAQSLAKRYHLGRLGARSFGRSLRAAWERRRGLSSVDSEEFWALRDVTFEVCEGEVVGIVGHNGAGKSTLLKLLSRITEPTSGQIKLRGRVSSLLEVGTGFHPDLTGRENAYLNGAILGMNRAEVAKKLDEIIDFSGIERFIDTPVKRYSSGMTVRLGFAVAAHLEPDILVVDEVLTVGDAGFRAKCLGKMQAFGQSGRTVLFVSHQMAAVSSLCTRGLLLHEGKVAMDGTTDDVLAEYATRTLIATNDSLRDRPDRRGDKRFLFTKVEFLDSKQNTVSTLRTGKPAIIRIHFEPDSSTKRGDLLISFALYTITGHRLSIFNSEASGSNLKLESLSHSHVDVHIEKWPFAEGRYTYNLYGSLDGELADWITHAGDLTVHNDDFYETGKLPSCRQGEMLVEHRFESLAREIPTIAR